MCIEKEAEVKNLKVSLLSSDAQVIVGLQASMLV